MIHREKFDTGMLGVVAAVFGVFLSVVGIVLAIDGVLFDLARWSAVGVGLIVCGSILYILPAF